MTNLKTKAVDQLLAKGAAARAAGRLLSRTPSGVKDQALRNIAQALESRQEQVLEANQRDYDAAKNNGLSDALLDRLLLTKDRLQAMAEGVREVADLRDPVGEVLDMAPLPNGLLVGKRRVPLGVVGSIYESRPDVTVDISVLCLKSGNACLLRGGKESLNSNLALVGLIRNSISEAGIPPEAVEFVDNTDRSLVNAMLSMKEYVDLIVPRGGPELIRFVEDNAVMPAITGGVGVCHTYIDQAADVEKAAGIVSTMLRCSGPTFATPWTRC